MCTARLPTLWGACPVTHAPQPSMPPATHTPSNARPSHTCMPLPMPLIYEQNDRRFWKYYLPATSFAGGNYRFLLRKRSSAFTARQRSCGKVMLSVVSVCHSVLTGEGASVKGLALLPSPDIFKLVHVRPYCAGTPPPPPQTCLNLFLMKHVQSASGL